MTPNVSPPVLLTVPEAIQFYGDSQGNIIKSHGRSHVSCLFVAFGDVANFRNWIKQLLSPTSAVQITSTVRQLQAQAEFKRSGKDGGLFASLLFTSAGLRFLQVPSQKMPHDVPDQSQGRTDAFDKGMRDASTTQALQDPALSEWDPGWHTGTQPTPVHALLLLADSDANRLQKATADQTKYVQSLHGTVQVQEHGTRLLENGHDIEHFGYADGVSQPIYLKDEDSPQRDILDKTLGVEQLAFLHDKLGAPDKSWGSFLVFRKLNQQVPAFKTAEELLACQLGMTGTDAERAGALLVGRFEDGTPVTLQSHDGLAPLTNHFDYAADQQGLKCPFHAHIRKMNPRHPAPLPPTPGTPELRHRITRRGVPYGTVSDAQQGKPAGLLFMCYQRSIGQQFEFMQQQWADNAGFPQAGVGLDPIIGQGQRTPLTFHPVWNAATPSKPASFAQFVTLRGGEYFYAPSMTGLTYLSQAPAKV